MGQPWLRVKISALGEVSSGNKGHRNGVEWSNLRVVDTSRQQKQKQKKKSNSDVFKLRAFPFNATLLLSGRTAVTIMKGTGSHRYR